MASVFSIIGFIITTIIVFGIWGPAKTITGLGYGFWFYTDGIFDKFLFGLKLPLTSLVRETFGPQLLELCNSGFEWASNAESIALHPVLMSIPKWFVREASCIGYSIYASAELFLIAIIIDVFYYKHILFADKREKEEAERDKAFKAEQKNKKKQIKERIISREAIDKLNRGMQTIIASSNKPMTKIYMIAELCFREEKRVAFEVIEKGKPDARHLYVVEPSPSYVNSTCVDIKEIVFNHTEYDEKKGRYIIRRSSAYENRNSFIVYIRNNRTVRIKDKDIIKITEIHTDDRLLSLTGVLNEVDILTPVASFNKDMTSVYSVFDSLFEKIDRVRISAQYIRITRLEDEDAIIRNNNGRYDLYIGKRCIAQGKEHYSDYKKHLEKITNGFALGEVHVDREDFVLDAFGGDYLEEITKGVAIDRAKHKKPFVRTDEERKRFEEDKRQSEEAKEFARQDRDFIHTFYD